MCGFGLFVFWGMLLNCSLLSEGVDSSVVVSVLCMCMCVCEMHAVYVYACCNY